MNSTEHQQFTPTGNSETAKTKAIPTESEIAETIAILANKINLIEISTNDNFAIREGCAEAVEILGSKKSSYHEISDEIVTNKGWAIAVLAVEYLNGNLDGKIFEELPVK
ncbi:hypothetical protein L0663_18310 [Dyadobacter sp. CY107]|uniref:hypothetical protein n=1 Tax=Dyadobacter fanqingshengii TaxID=2906443 RepID=UPI001F2E829F|nr:hypothetical protein [Dyadobacter fanqingshengii]MCF2505351.1 hypothetical protein [Dyadobacter fanqingshengii]